MLTSMRAHLASYGSRYFLAILLSLGCATPSPSPQPSYQAPAPKTYVVPSGNSALEIADLTIHPSSESSVSVSGHVSRCAYEIREYYEGGARYYNHSTSREEYQKFDSRPRWWKDVQPSRLRVRGEYLRDAFVDVPSDGDFAVTLTALDGYSVNRSKFRPNNKYWEIVAVKPFQMIFQVWPSPDGIPIAEYHSPLSIDMFSLKPRDDKVRAYAQLLTTDVQLLIKDKITRLPVSPQIRITGTSVTKREDLERLLEREFSSPGLARNVMRQVVPQYLGQGETITADGQSASFVGLVGSSYRVETTHGEYYYFSGILTPKASPVQAKDILLVEKGSKVRQEDVKEGEGGVIVDTPRP